MTEETELRTFYDQLHSRQVVQIRNKYTYVESFWTDEMDRNTRRNDRREAKRMLILALCQEWYELTGKELVPVDGGPGTAWQLEEVKHDEGESSSDR